jgi:serine/threonine-protein kinase
VVLAPRVSVTSRLNLESSPDALSRDARAHIRTFGYTSKPADAVWGMAYDSDYQGWSFGHLRETASRWKNPGAGQPPLVQFWYRESPQPITAVRQFNTAVSYNDPPAEQSGSIRLKTDPEGRLTQFEAVPPQVEKEGQGPASPFDWNLLFRAAGLDPANFQTAEPLWTPLVSWDAHAAWTGVDAPTGTKLRLEAAAWRGRPVYFQIIGPWTARTRTSAGANGSAQGPIMVLVYSALLGAMVLAWRNLRSGKADLRGALRLSAIYVICMLGANLLRMHHTATIAELNGFWLSVGAALVNGSLEWVFYVALEPWVRKKWPRTMISWTRYAAKGAKDPLVGRDLLYGSVLGAGLALINGIAPLVHGNGGQPLFPPLSALSGLRAVSAGVFSAIPAAIFTALLFFFVIFVLRLISRRDWIAGIVFVLLLTLASTFGTPTPVPDYTLNALAYVMFAFALLRWGLLSAIVLSTVSQIIEMSGVLDLSAWYGGMAFLPLLVVLAIAVWGFRAALGGRALWREAD